MNAVRLTLPDRDRDALLEVINIGSGNALSALSRMLSGVRLDMSVPQWLYSPNDIGARDLNGDGVLVSMDVVGPWPCGMAVAMEQQAASELAAALLRRSVEPLMVGGEPESALVESVNILSCSFLGAFAALVPGVFVPRPPVVVYGKLAALLRTQMGPNGLAIGNRFVAKNGGIAGHILWLANADVATSVSAGLRPSVSG